MLRQLKTASNVARTAIATGRRPTPTTLKPARGYNPRLRVALEVRPADRVGMSVSPFFARKGVTARSVQRCGLSNVRAGRGQVKRMLRPGPGATPGFSVEIATSNQLFSNAYAPIGQLASEGSFELSRFAAVCGALKDSYRLFQGNRRHRLNERAAATVASLSASAKCSSPVDPASVSERRRGVSSRLFPADFCAAALKERNLLWREFVFIASSWRVDLFGRTEDAQPH
jgi:hypothetical protein